MSSEKIPDEPAQNAQNTAETEPIEASEAAETAPTESEAAADDDVSESSDVSEDVPVEEEPSTVNEETLPETLSNREPSGIGIFPYLEQLHLNYEEEEEELEEEEIKYHYIEILDAPRELLPPVELTLKDLTHIANELGLIKLCWPEIETPEFENRVNFPESYLTNSNKEKLLLLYTENFRRQFCYKYPNRKQLFLASNNECGMQKMVCNTIRPTTLPYPEIETWQDCAKFVGEALRFEPFDIPTLIVPTDVTLLDFQAARYSSPILDLSNFLFSCLSANDFENLNDILEAYHKFFINHLQKMGMDKAELVYPFEKFMDDWKSYSKFGVIMTNLLMKTCSTDKNEVVNLDIRKERIRPVIEYAAKHDLI